MSENKKVENILSDPIADIKKVVEGLKVIRYCMSKGEKINIKVQELIELGEDALQEIESVQESILSGNKLALLTIKELVEGASDLGMGINIGIGRNPLVEAEKKPEKEKGK